MFSSMQNKNGLNLQILKAKFILLMFTTKQKVDLVTLVIFFFKFSIARQFFKSSIILAFKFFFRDYE